MAQVTVHDKPKWLYPAILIISLLLMGYNIARVLSVPVTFDEAGTFFDYASSSFYNIITCNPPTANNHILNSLLTKISIRIFHSEHQFILRLPNVLAHVVYLIFSCKLSRALFKSNKWILISFLLLNFNPFLFDFWGLSRGYGLSIALMTLSLYAVVKYIQQNHWKWLLLTLGTTILSVYSNFALLNYYVALVGILFFNTMLFQLRTVVQIIRETMCIAISAWVIYLLIAEPVAILKEKQQFYYGGNNGIIHDTISSVIAESFHFETSQQWLAIAVAYIIAAFVLCAGVYWIIATLKEKNKHTNIGLLLWLLLFLPALSLVVQHYLFGTLYLIERTALFFWPLFIIHLCYFLCSVRQKRIALPTGTIITIIIAVNFVAKVNTTYARTWEYDKNTLTVIDRMVKANPGKPVKVNLYWLFMYSFKYYQHTRYSGQLQHIELRWENPPPATVYDYYYINNADLVDVPPGYIEDTTFMDGKYVLLKKKD